MFSRTILRLMPELPEVETYRRYLEETSLFQPITNLFVEDHKLLTTDFDVLVNALRSRSFIATRRVGKNLFVQLDAPDSWLHLHFGMTGDLAYFRDAEDTPPFARILFYFQNGFRLAFICPRKFERVGLVSDPDAYLKSKKIGPDGLDVSMDELSAKTQRSASPIKPLLMNQSTVAGLGNWIVDEVLFQAQINPKRLAKTLSSDEVRRVHEAIKKVLTTAIQHEADYARFPKSFLIHAREWAASPYENSDEHTRCPRCGGPLSIEQVGGRTTYFCPNCQPMQ